MRVLVACAALARPDTSCCTYGAVLLRPSTHNRPPYWIDNFSPYTLRVQQKDVSKRLLYLRPYQGVPYAWESVLPQADKHELVIEVEGSSPLLTGSFQLDRVGEHPPILKGGRAILYASVRCDGPTLTLTIVDAKLHPQCKPAQPGTVARMQPGAEAAAAGKSEQPSARPHDKGPGANTTQLANWFAQVDMRMVGIGVSLVESEKQREVLYLWLGAEPAVAFSDKQQGVNSAHSAGVSLSVWRRRHEDGLALAITCVQVDNLAHAAACPVVVCRSHGSRLSTTSGAGAEHTFALTLAKTSFSGSPIQVRIRQAPRVLCPSAALSLCCGDNLHVGP